MKWIRGAIYFVVDYKSVAFGLSVVIASLMIVFSTEQASFDVLKLVLSSASSIGFTLFGFSVTALSILASLRFTPFVQKLQKSNETAFKNITNYFTYSAILLFLFGIIGLFISPSLIVSDPKILKLTPVYHNIPLSIICFLIFLLASVSLIFSLNCLFLLRLLVLGNEDEDTQSA